MKKIIIVFTVLLLSIGHSQAQQQESFDTFFQKFSADATYQKSRIKFPLAMVTVDDDDSNTTKFISRNKWEFYNIRLLKKDKKNIFKISHPKKDQVVVERQLEGTGVSLSLIFKIVEGKWQMVEFRDESD